MKLMKLISQSKYTNNRTESQAIQAKRIKIKSLKSRQMRIERKMRKLRTRFGRRGPADPALNHYWREYLCPEHEMVKAMLVAAEIELRLLIEKEGSK